MILILFLGTARFGAASPNPFAPTLDALSNENAPLRISDSFRSARPAYQGNADGPMDSSAFSSTPANLFGSTIEQMAFDPNNRDTSSLQQVASTILQGVPQPQTLRMVRLQISRVI